MPVISTDAAAAGVRAELDGRDTDNRSRANHTGTQAAATISDFDAAAMAASADAIAAIEADQGAQDSAIAAITTDVATLEANAFSGQYSALLGIPSTFAPSAHNQAWSTITSTPTTLAGYGIGDAETTTQLNTRDAANRVRANHTGTQAAATISDFDAVAAAAAPVQSVAGRGGAVVLAKADVGLAAVDNTSDAAKPVSTATQTALDAKAPLTAAQATITYAATVDLDLSALNGRMRTISLTGNLTLTSSNRTAERSVTLRLICDATLRTLTFPAGWVFLGAKPANIAAAKVGVLSLTFFGTADSDCVAAWGVQA